jgi:hypothetical protein
MRGRWTHERDQLRPEAVAAHQLGPKSLVATSTKFGRPAGGGFGRADESSEVVSDLRLDSPAAFKHLVGEVSHDARAIGRHQPHEIRARVLLCGPDAPIPRDPGDRT